MELSWLQEYHIELCKYILLRSLKNFWNAQKQLTPRRLFFLLQILDWIAPEDLLISNDAKSYIIVVLFLLLQKTLLTRLTK